MTTRLDLDRTLAEWFRANAGEAMPDYLDELVDRVAREPQRRWWSSPERWLPVDLTSRATTFAPPRFGRLLLVALLIMAIAALAIVAIGSRSQRLPPPFGPALNGSILSSTVSGDILSMEPDGSNARTIISDPAYDFGPWFSHDGTRFAFWRRVATNEFQVMVANADGSAARPLSGRLPGADWYEWSPADDLVAVIQTRSLQRVLTILDAKGSEPPRDVDLGALDVDNDVFWLPPNGDELIFTARASLDDKDSGLYAVRRDGTGLRLLAPIATEHYFDLTVAPDGKTIAYSNIEPDSSDNGIGWHIHVRDLQTGADRQVTFGPRKTGNVDEHGPAISPDGRQLLLWAEDGNLAHLMVVPSDGSDGAQVIGPPLTNNGDFNYAFAPDGRTAILNVGLGTTWLIDLGSGEGAKLDDPIRNFSSWQRLAPPLP
jgi:Tol biopolymer transport system component